MSQLYQGLKSKGQSLKSTSQELYAISEKASLSKGTDVCLSRSNSVKWRSRQVVSEPPAGSEVNSPVVNTISNLSAAAPDTAAKAVAPRCPNRVTVLPRNGFADIAPRCDLERIAIVVSDSTGDEESAQVVVRPNDLAAVLHAKNILWGKSWGFEESWQVAHPVMDDEPLFVDAEGNDWWEF